MNTTLQTSTDYISLALQLAEQGRNTVSPNPMVGCVLVKNGAIVATGYHQFSGQPHAEAHALMQAKENAEGATAYITLEPCCHTDKKTPPCTQALISAGIKKVVIACLDPNPKVSGAGVKMLQDAGIEVELGILEEQSKRLNEIFFYYMRTKKPFVISKWAMSLDGKTITNDEDSRVITGSDSQHTTHLLRQQVDAILVGANTARNDNPQLTARSSENTSNRHPLRIVLTARGDLPLDLKLFNSSLPGKTLIATTEDANSQWCDALREKHIEILLLPKTSDGLVDINCLLEELGRRNITSLLVEGGMTVHHSFMQQHAINKLQVFIAPVLIGPWSKKKSCQPISITQSGSDLHINTELTSLNDKNILY